MTDESDKLSHDPSPTAPIQADDASGSSQRATDWASSDSPTPAHLLADSPDATSRGAATHEDDAVTADVDEDLARSARHAAPLEPVSGWMLRVALLLIVVLLVTTGSLVLFLMSLREAPRTVAERNLSAAQSAVHDRPNDVDSWSALVYAYSQAKRYDDAIAAAEKGRSVTKADVLLVAEADVLRSAGRLKDAVAEYDRASKAIESAQADATAARKKMGVFVPLGDATMIRVYYGRALALHALGDVKPAIADLEKAVALAPEQAYLFVTLGDYYAETRANGKAEAAYRNALRYVPDYPEALAGLKRIAGGR